MTRKFAKENMPLLQGYADGKIIQFKSKDRKEWDENQAAIDDLSFLDDLQYRIKPEPKLRAWRSYEIVVGSLIRWNTGLIHMIVASNPMNSKCVRIVEDAGIRDYDPSIFVGCEHSTDGGKTWHPCGVYE